MTSDAIGFDALSGSSHEFLMLWLLQEFYLSMNADKKTSPSEVIPYLGTQIDVSNATISIDPDELHTIYLECLGSQHKKYLTKKGLWLLIGKLIYVHKCVAPARDIINRILTLLMNSANRNKIKLIAEFLQTLTLVYEVFTSFQWYHHA